MSELSVGQLKGLAANSNMITVPSGHTLYPPGHIIQTVTLDNTTRATQGFSDGVSLDVSGMSLDITPKSANSKILIQARWFGELSGADRVYNSVFAITRNGTRINYQTGTSTVASGLTIPALSYEGTDADSTGETMSLFTTDSPASTSLLTYKLVYISSGNGGTISTNRVMSWNNQSGGYELGTSGMILMEIAQ